MEQRYMIAWQNAIQKIEEEVSPFVFDAWYKDLHPVDVMDNVYIIEANNDNICKSMVQQGLNDRINNWLYHFLNEYVQTQFVTAGTYFPSKQASTTPTVEEEIPTMPGQLYLEVLDGHRLQEDYTFDTFVIGKNNEHCRAFCKAIADDMTNDLNCAKKINPLFIYGSSGLGKTHLMNAIAFQILQAHPHAKIKFTTCENFMNEYIASISSNQNAAFRKKYRNVDILLIDDIQFLTGKEGTQEEFFHTFEELRNNNRQIIITSDKLPREIPDLEERLVTRFEGGVLTDIQIPNFETRIAILQKKAEMENAIVDNRVIEYIVNNVDDNIRTLQGSLQTLIVTARITNQPITLELAETVIKNKVTHEKQITSDLIITKVCERYGLSKEKMMGTSRKKEILVPRQLSMYLCRQLLSMSLPSIGKLFGKDHSTVSNSIDKIEDSLKNDVFLQGDLNAIKKSIENS